MKYSKLANYLALIGDNVRRVQIAKQILAENTNFCPAQLISKMQQNTLENSQKNQRRQKNHLNSQNFKNLFSLIKFQESNTKMKLILEYFGIDKEEQILYKNFIQLLLPNQKEELKKSVMRRNPLGIEFSQQLKYALRRFFEETIAMTQNLKLQFQNIKLINSKKTQQNKIQLERLQRFMKNQGKYASDMQISLILNFMTLNKCKELNTKKIIQIINEYETQMNLKHEKNNQYSSFQHDQIDESFVILANSTHNQGNKKEETSLFQVTKLDSSQANTTYHSKANKFLIEKSRQIDNKFQNKENSLSVSKLQDQLYEGKQLKCNENRHFKTKKTNSIIFSQQNKEYDSQVKINQKLQEGPQRIFNKIIESQTKNKNGMKEMLNIKYSSKSKLNQQNNAQFINTKEVSQNNSKLQNHQLAAIKNSQGI